MTTQAQIEANRRNSQKSTGPRTPEGKARVALNALKHGIRAGALVVSLQNTPLFDDDPQAFADLVQALVDHYHPEGPVEEACVEDIAICRWRLRRVTVAETGYIASAQAILLSGPGANNPRLRARNGLPNFDELERLNRYEVSVQRQLKRSLDTLAALIRDRQSRARQSGATAGTKQDAGRGGEIAAIRREVLGYLLNELGSNEFDPEIECAVSADDCPDQSPTTPGCATADEEGSSREQSQIAAVPPAAPTVEVQPVARDLPAGAPDTDDLEESIPPTTARISPPPSTSRMVSPADRPILGRPLPDGCVGAEARRNAQTKPSSSST